MSVIIKDMGYPVTCRNCGLAISIKPNAFVCPWENDYIAEKGERLKNCPLKSVEGMIAKVLSEVDGGTDDKYIRYIDVCERIEKSIKEYCEVSE